MLAARAVRRLRPAVAVVVAALVVVPAGAEAKSGSVGGTLGAAVPAKGLAEVRAISAKSGQVVAVRRVARSGRFRLTLPPGGYVLTTTVLGGPGHYASGAKRTSLAVSLRSGQQRRGVALTRKKPKAKANKKARAAFVTESGVATPGAAAVGITAFTGATGDFAGFDQGLPGLLITDVVGPGGGCEPTIVEVMRRDEIRAEGDLWKSGYVDPSSVGTQDFIAPDVLVTGTLSTTAQGLGYTVALVDARSGAVLDTLSGTLPTADVFGAEAKLAKALKERICKLSDTYRITLADAGTGSFATHTASGTLNAVLTATRTGGGAGAGSGVWQGTGALEWSALGFASKTPCPYTSYVGTGGSWTVTLALQPDGTLKVTWEPRDTLATASIDCPPLDADSPDPPPIPAQPGPSLIGVTPGTFTIPAAGGTQPISGGFTDGGDGWTTTGSLKIEPAAALAP